jgi:DNA-directed RNA polymerase subunit omega
MEEIIMTEVTRKNLSMIEPSIGKLMTKVDSRYTLVVLTAKRARALSDGAESLIFCGTDKAVTVAINEIDEGKISYIRTKTGIK